MKKVKAILSTMMLLAGAVAVMLPVQACSEDETEEIPPVGTINGHEYVDLGLSVKWAACNVGASEPSGYGYYFQWGEIVEPSDLNYSSDNCRLDGKSEYNGMAVTEENIKGDPEFDAATANWGGAWRLPTADEIEELVDECQWKRATLDDHNGYRVTGPNGNSIFLPAAGYYLGATLYYVGEYGYCWSSSPDEGRTYRAYGLGFYSGDFDLNYYDRCDGQSVRPVIDK